MLTMNVISHHIEITDAIRSYVQEKMDKLEKYLEGVSPIKITVELRVKAPRAKGKPRATVEVTMHIPELIIRCEETNSDMYEAIDLVQAKVERKLRNYKDRILHLRRNQGENPTLKPRDIQKIVKRKKFPVGTPITEEEAITRMDLLGHDFYLFTEKKTKQPKVVYKRKDGGYGILTAE